MQSVPFPLSLHSIKLLCVCRTATGFVGYPHAKVLNLVKHSYVIGDRAMDERRKLDPAYWSPLIKV